MTSRIRNVSFALLFLVGLSVGAEQAVQPVTFPVIAEDISPVESFTPVAADGIRGEGFIRKPPGAGPFPAVLVILPGLTRFSTSQLRQMAFAPQRTRYLAAGYVVAVITYRSRDADPQSQEPIADSVAAVRHLQKLPFVDPKSVVIGGCSGGGDLALEVAAATDVAAIAPEEPATVLFTGVFNKDVPKSGERHTPADAFPIIEDPKRYYTPPYQKHTQEKVRRIRAPSLILQGDEQFPLNQFNRLILVAELKSAGKQFDVISFPGEEHCFGFIGRGKAAPAALKMFEASEAFFRRHVPTKPKPMDATQLKYEPIK
jgi:dipeptidyl aminopeptidase/acylaminoacyl peptidase